MTGVRAQRAASTREVLIDAGLHLAERTGLSGMSVNLVVEEAAVAKGTFFHHFGNRGGFLLAIHREFHDRLFADITEAVVELVPGRERLLAAATAYLDGCLHQPGIRSLLLEARAEPLIAAEISRRNKHASELISPDFANMGWSHPREAAALWNGLVVEAALLELSSRRRQPKLRAALTEFLGTQPTPSSR